MTKETDIKLFEQKQYARYGMMMKGNGIFL
jgi:hypothetical protein